MDAPSQRSGRKRRTSTAKEDDVTTHRRMPFRILWIFAIRSSISIYDTRSSIKLGASSSFLGALSIGTKVLNLRPAILAIEASISGLFIPIFAV